MKEAHRFRNITIISIAAYFCAQSFFIVFKLWTTLNFDDKVNAMETVLLTTVVLCEALEILYLSEFDDIMCGMFVGELFGRNRRMGLKHGELSRYRGREIMREYDEKLMKNIGNHGKYGEKGWGNSFRATKRNRFENEGGNYEKRRWWGSEKSTETKIHEKHLEGKFDGQSSVHSKGTKMFNNVDENSDHSGNKYWLKNRENFTKNNIYNDNAIENEHKSVGKSLLYDGQTQGMNVHNNNFERSQNVDVKFRSTPYINEAYITDRFGNESHVSKGSLEEVLKNSKMFNSFEDNFYETKLDEGDLRGDRKRDKQYFSHRSSTIIEEMLAKNFELVKVGMLSFIFLCVALLIVPIFSFVGYMAGFIEFEKLHLSFLVYIPFTDSSSPDNIFQYVVVMIAQIIYVLMFYTLSSDSYIMAILCNATLKTEMKLFMNNLEEFDAIYCMKHWKRMEDGLMVRLESLRAREKFEHIVSHHQMIYRKLSAYQKIIARNSIYIHSAICVELCISLFLLQGEMFFKVKYTIGIICIGCALTQYSQQGQDIEDGFEEMGNALYGISWHNMSVNLRKSFAILLTRHSVPAKLSGSHGIFVINRKNLSMITRASYSYLNILNRIK